MVQITAKRHALKQGAPSRRHSLSQRRGRVVFGASLLALLLGGMTVAPASAEIPAVAAADAMPGQIVYETRDGLRTAVFPERADEIAVRAVLPDLRDRDIQSVVLRGSLLRDAGLFKELRDLKALDISGSQIRDLAPLAALRQVETLNLRFLRVSDLRPLTGLTGLRRLNVGGTDVSDLAPLAGMTELLELNVAVTKVRDLTPLTLLRRLTSLDIGSTWVSDLRPLAGLSGLRSLNANGTPVDDARPLAGLISLQTLDLGGTQVAEIQALSGLRELRSLDIEGTMVSDVAPLATLSLLRSVAAGGSRVQDMTVLAHLLAAPKDTTNATDSDPVLMWNQITNQAIKASNTDPFEAARALAIESVAVLDTIKSIDGIPAFLIRLPAPRGIPADIAVAAAAHDVLVHLFPSRKLDFDATLAAAVAAEPAGPQRDMALAFGSAMAETLTMIRDEDGSMAPAVTHIGTERGQWRPTPPHLLSAAHPEWAMMVPFALREVSQFRPPGPPALDSEAYRTALARVTAMGDVRSNARTAEQTEIAHFWSDAPGSFTPPGHWNAIATGIVQPMHLGAAVEAELFAELNVALADTAMAVADTKYTYWRWRPVTAVPVGAEHEPGTPGWNPLLETPNHPSYVSGHSGFSGAAATILTKWFGNRSFSSASPGLPGVVRSFSSFQQAAEEAAASRLYAGLHFEFDNTDGLALGRSVGDWTMRLFQRLNEDRGPTIIMMDPAMAMAGQPSEGRMGCAVDNTSPVTSVSVRMDDGAPFTVAVDGKGVFRLAPERVGHARHAEVTATSQSGRSTAIRIAIN